MIKVLFFIPNLANGGAEKVLVNLVNNMDKSKFDVTVQTLFAGGVNEQFLNEDINYRYYFKKTFRGNSHILKLFSPKTLYKKFIKEHYDIIVSYLEGPTARIVSGCTDNNTKLVSWIHCKISNQRTASIGFRNFGEAKKCYNKYDNTVCVSNGVMNYFTETFDFKKMIEVLYNTNETEKIIEKSNEVTDVEIFNEDEVNICVVGKVSVSKGCDRIVRIQKRLIDDGIKSHVYFLGTGTDEEKIQALVKENRIENSVTFLGYQKNPYKYLKECDLFVCASLSEGFSTAATEALIVGTPVVTVEVSGMKEMLGENNEYGIVTENNEDALYEGIKKMITTPGMLEDYAKRAKNRGKEFSTEKTVRAVEKMFEGL